MKKNFLTAVAVSLLLGTMPALAQQFTSGTLTYTVLDATAGTVALTGATAATPAELVIPAIVENDGVSYIVKVLGANAFASATGMTAVTIPATVDSLANGVFFKTSKLKSVTCLGKTPPDIEASPFASLTYTNGTLHVPAGCWYSYLTSWRRFFRINEPGAKDVAVDGRKYTIFSPTEKYARIVGNSYEGDFTIPATIEVEGDTYKVVEVGGYCFDGRTGITSVTVPDGILVVSDYAFRGTTGLKSLSLPGSVMAIKAGFITKGGITEFTFPKNIVRVENITFQNCTALTTVTLPESAEVINASAFAGCTALTTVNGGANLREIYSGAFNGATKLVNFTLPQGLELLENSSFTGTGISFTKLPPKIKTVRASAFKNCYNLKYVDVSAIENFESSCFQGSGLERIDMPSSVKTFGTMIFQDCKQLKRIILPANLDKVPIQTFYNCSSLDSVVLPGNITTLSNYAFRDCSSLKNIVLPKGMEGYAIGCFMGCTALEEITLPGKDNVQVAANVFNGCTSLRKAVMPSSLTVIAQNLFNGCKSLTQVEMSDEVTMIYPSAFKGCSSLTSFSTPHALRTIGLSAFENCTALTSIRLRANVDSIARKAFAGCTALQDITVRATVPPKVVDATAFADTTYTMATLSVPASSVNAYKNASVWMNFTNTVVGVTTANADSTAVVRRYYYDLTGRRLSAEAGHGVTVIVEVLDDGTRRIRKSAR